MYHSLNLCGKTHKTRKKANHPAEDSSHSVNCVSENNQQVSSCPRRIRVSTKVNKYHCWLSYSNEAAHYPQEPCNELNHMQMKQVVIWIREVKSYLGQDLKRNLANMSLKEVLDNNRKEFEWKRIKNDKNIRNNKWWRRCREREIYMLQVGM